MPRPAVHVVSSTVLQTVSAHVSAAFSVVFAVQTVFVGAVGGWNAAAVFVARKYSDVDVHS